MRVLLAILVFVLAACTTTGANTSAPSTAPATSSTVPTTAAPSTSSTPEDVRKAGEAYLVSTERVATYVKLWPAASKVAQAILDDKFGAYTVYEQAKQPNFVGWGSLHATNATAYAAVWWSGGKPDTSKVTGFALYGVQIETGFGDNPYHVSFPRDGYTGVVDAAYMGETKRQLDPFRHHTSVKMAQEFDAEAFALLEAGLKDAGL